jgi:hypothetical protein
MQSLENMRAVLAAEIASQTGRPGADEYLADAREALADIEAQIAKNAARAVYCSHGVPTNAPCRWCADGTEPKPVQHLPEAERIARRAAIRAQFEQAKKSESGAA